MRLSERIKTFKKGYLPQWAEEVFRIQRVIQGPVLMYKVEEIEGTPVKGTFYAEDLQKVTVDNDMLWRVEKVLKTTSRANVSALERLAGQIQQLD